jgi:hypothetical protein
MTTKSEQNSLITREDATSILLSQMFSMIEGSPKGKGVMYSLLEETDNFFFFCSICAGPLNSKFQ